MQIKITSRRDGRWEWEAGGNGGVESSKDDALGAARQWLRCGS